MTRAEIECLSDDNGRSHFRSQRIDLGGGKLVTPARALEPTRISAHPGYDSDQFSFTEGYRSLNSDSVAKCLQQPDSLEDANAKLRLQCAKGPSRAAKLAFVSYAFGAGEAWPKKPAIELLTDLAYSNSTVVPIPILEHKITLSELPRFREYLDLSYRAIQRQNNKPVMGVLPVKMPREGIKRIIEWYISRDINCFSLDFGGTEPDHLKLRTFTARLAERNALNNSLLYGINARAGKFVKNATAIPARDFFVYGLGLDILGGSHKAAMVPAGARAKGRRSGSRVFSLATYGYHKLGSDSSPIDSGGPITRAAIAADPSGRVGKLYNMDAHRRESSTLVTRLSKLGRRETVLTYVRSKTMAESSIGQFRRDSPLDA